MGGDTEIEEKAKELEKSFYRSCVEGYRDAKIVGKREKNFHALVNQGQLKEWCLWIAQKLSETHYRSTP